MLPERDLDVLITGLETLRSPYRHVRVTLDGEERLDVPAPVTEALSLSEGMCAHRGDLMAAIARESVTAGLEVAFAFLASRGRSEQEVRRRLTRAAYPEQAVEEIISRLYGYGYLNDEEFADRFVQGRLRSHPMGRRGLAWELRRRGVDAATVEAATTQVEEADERAAALELVRAKASRLPSTDPRKARQRLAAMLQRRGFSWDIISGVLTEVLGGED